MIDDHGVHEPLPNAEELLAHPPVRPEIAPEPLAKDEHRGPFALNVHLGHLAPVDGPEQCVWVRWKPQTQKTLDVVHIQRGPDTLVNGRLCQRHERELYETGYTDQPRETITLFHEATERELLERLVSTKVWVHDEDEPRLVRQVATARVVYPRRINLGERFEVDYFAYGQPRERRPTSWYEADGVFRLHQHGREHIALCLRHLRDGGDGRRAAYDYYIDTETGHLLYRCRYDGPGFKSHAQLEGQPEVEIDGERFRLLFEEVLVT